MLKMKTPDTVIPTVQTMAQTNLVDERRSGSPASLPLSSRATTPELIPTAISLPVSPPQLTEITTESKASVTPPIKELLRLFGNPAVVEVAPTSISEGLSNLVNPAHPPELPLSVDSTLDVFHQLWPKVNQEMKHLIDADGATSAAETSVGEPQDAEDSPVIEEMLQTPSIGHSVSDSLASGKSFGNLDYRTPLVSSNVPDPRPTPQSPVDNQPEPELVDAMAQQGPLSSAFIADTTVPDGQIFPPGAEFVKSWHMLNNGKLPWPATTELQFVAGEMFASEHSVGLKAKVGFVCPGEDLDIWTGDLKAPEDPGRYVGYWRLCDGRGNFFGSSICIDLSVANHSFDGTSEHSLAASLMVMPSPHRNSVTASEEPQTGLLVPPSSLSTKPVTDEVEDSESDNSSVSLVSVPTSDDEDAEWQDTRTHSEPLEYVVLYDSNSDDE
jgi:next-to-BRCA1 protein 1